MIVIGPDKGTGELDLGGAPDHSAWLGVKFYLRFRKLEHALAQSTGLRAL
jgi:hypothetical protein